MDQPQKIYDPDSEEQHISGFLNEALTDVVKRVGQRQKEVSIAGLQGLISMQKRPLDLMSVLRHNQQLSLIVEIKKQSHTGVQLVEGRYEPDEIARFFAESGVQAVAVATNPRYYAGQLHHITYVSTVVRIPVIRQDFVFDRYQVYEARAAGADAVILIASLLGEIRLWDLVSLTQRLNMTAVVQVADEAELKQAVEAGPRVIVISNVDWRTLEVDFDITRRLSVQVPQENCSH